MNRGGLLRDDDAVSFLAGTHGVVAFSGAFGYPARGLPRPRWRRADGEELAMNIETRPTLTPEDLLRMPDGDRYELVDGQLVEEQMSLWSSYVAGQVYWLLSQFNAAARLGWVLPETGYQCFPAGRVRVRRPDVSFLPLARM